MMYAGVMLGGPDPVKVISVVSGVLFTSPPNCLIFKEEFKRGLQCQDLLKKFEKY